MGARDVLEEASAASLALEAAKARGAGDTSALEEALDRGWALAEEVSRGLGRAEARVVVDRCLWGMTWPEISEDCGMPVRTAQRALSRAIAWLDGRGCGEGSPTA